MSDLAGFLSQLNVLSKSQLSAWITHILMNAFVIQYGFALVSTPTLWSLPSIHFLSRESLLSVWMVVMCRDHLQGFLKPALCLRKGIRGERKGRDLDSGTLKGRPPLLTLPHTQIKLRLSWSPGTIMITVPGIPTICHPSGIQGPKTD